MSNPAYDSVQAQLSGGGDLTLDAMDEIQLWDVGRKTYRFVSSVRRNPELWAMVQKRAAEIRAQEAVAQCL